jgi:hypothetical protein
MFWSLASRKAWIFPEYQQTFTKENNANINILERILPLCSEIIEFLHLRLEGFTTMAMRIY